MDQSYMVINAYIRNVIISNGHSLSNYDRHWSLPIKMQTTHDLLMDENGQKSIRNKCRWRMVSSKWKKAIEKDELHVSIFHPNRNDRQLFNEINFDGILCNFWIFLWQFEMIFTNFIKIEWNSLRLRFYLMSTSMRSSNHVSVRLLGNLNRRAEHI